MTSAMHAGTQTRAVADARRKPRAPGQLEFPSHLSRVCIVSIACSSSCCWPSEKPLASGPLIVHNTETRVPSAGPLYDFQVSEIVKFELKAHKFLQQLGFRRDGWSYLASPC